jgi:AcrR family transcriptional regulator
MDHLETNSGETTRAQGQQHAIRDKDATRQRLLDAAEDVFAEKGYHGTVVDDIIRVSDSSKGGFYFHFPNKQAIFLALLDRLALILKQRVAEAVSTRTDPVARAEAALGVVLDTFASHRRLARLFMVEALGAGPEFNARMVKIRADFADLIREQLDAAVAAGAVAPLDTRTTASAWFGAVNEVILQWALSDGQTRLEDTYPTVRTLLLRGIGVEVPSP